MIDCMIVGAGLAGCHLALKLQERGLRVSVYAGTRTRCASEVAAGVLNPVTGKRIALTWRIDQLLSEARECYRSIELRLGGPLFHETGLRRFCLSEKEVETFHTRQGQPGFEPYLGPYQPAGEDPVGIIDEHGSFTIRGVGYVDLPKCMETIRTHLRESGVLVDRDFDYAKLETSNHGFTYAGLDADRIIFCEGAGIRDNPWFNWLQFRPVKGEILRVSSNALQLPRTIYHHKKWLFRLEDGSFRIGSTYDRGTVDALPSAKGRDELLDACGSILEHPPPFSVIEHQAGIRPCTRDTRPYIGSHPQFPRMFVLNGLGSKGALISPWAAGHLADHLTADGAIDPEVDCTRHLNRRPQ